MTDTNPISGLFWKQMKTCFHDFFSNKRKHFFCKGAKSCIHNLFFCKWTKSQFYKSTPPPFSGLLIANKQKPVIMNCWTPNFTIFFCKLMKTRFHDFFVSKQKPDFRTFFSNEQKPGFRAFLANKQKADFTTFFANKWKPFFTTF